MSSCASHHPQFPTQTCRQPDVARTSTRWDPSASTSASLDTTCLALLGSPRSKWCWEHPHRLQGGKVRSTYLFERKHPWLCWRLYQEYPLLSHANDIEKLVWVTYGQLQVTAPLQTGYMISDQWFIFSALLYFQWQYEDCELPHSVVMS